jgi:hypothetical protein
MADYAIWALCAAFYMVDNLRLLQPREILLAERLNGGWTVLFPVSNYRIAGRTVTVTNLLTPFLAVYRMAWLSDEPFATRPMRTMQRMLRIRRARFRLLRWLSAALFVAFFVLGPWATYAVGLGVALLLALAIHLVALLVALWLLLAHARHLQLSRLQMATTLLEFAVCPGFFVNAHRKLLLGHSMHGDAVAYVLQQGDITSPAAIEAGIDRGIGDLDNNGELLATDRAAVTAYRERLSA